MEEAVISFPWFGGVDTRFLSPCPRFDRRDPGDDHVCFVVKEGRKERIQRIWEFISRNVSAIERVRDSREN